MDGCYTAMSVGELNLGPRQEQPVLFTAEPSPQPSLSMPRVGPSDDLSKLGTVGSRGEAVLSAFPISFRVMSQLPQFFRCPYHSALHSEDITFLLETQRAVHCWPSYGLSQLSQETMALTMVLNQEMDLSEPVLRIEAGGGDGGRHAGTTIIPSLVSNDRTMVS